MLDHLAGVDERALADVKHGHHAGAAVSARRDQVEDGRVRFLDVRDPAQVEQPARQLHVRADRQRDHERSFRRGFHCADYPPVLKSTCPERSPVF
jgi:hypothetical protein